MVFIIIYIELHKQTVNYLTKTYSKIIISTFESQKMGLLLDSKTTRVLRETLGLTHSVKPIVLPNRTSVKRLSYYIV